MARLARLRVIEATDRSLPVARRCASRWAGGRASAPCTALGWASGMALDPAVAEFDELSRVYDTSREPLEPEVVRSVATTLQGWGVRRLLEVGVGTGRVAAPLAALGLEVTGVDASSGMLARARAKHCDRLVRGTAYRLPFADRTFDASLFVHVLHILDEPARAIREACRVSALGTAALVRPAGPGGPEPERGTRPRALVIQRLRQQGIEVPDRAAGGPPVRERRLLEEHPPQRLVVLSERDVTEPLTRELALFEQGASRWTLRLPKEALAKAVAEVRAELGDGTHTYHSVQALALWETLPERGK